MWVTPWMLCTHLWAGPQGQGLLCIPGEAEQVGIVSHAGLGFLFMHQTNTCGCPGAHVQGMCLRG